MEEAKRSTESIRREAQLESEGRSLKLRAEVEHELRDKRGDLVKIEERVVAKEEDIDHQLTEFGPARAGARRRGASTAYRTRLKTATDGQLKELERISGMTVEEAKRRTPGA